jgi:hypothetical protein
MATNLAAIIWAMRNMNRRCSPRTVLDGNRIASSSMQSQVGVNHPVGGSSPSGGDQTDSNGASRQLDFQVFADLLGKKLVYLIMTWDRRRLLLASIYEYGMSSSFAQQLTAILL